MVDKNLQKLSKTSVEFVSFHWHLFVLGKKVWRENFEQVLYFVMVLFGKSLVSMHLYSARRQQVLCHALNHYVEEKTRVMHKFVHNEKICVTRLQQVQ